MSEMQKDGLVEFMDNGIFLTEIGRDFTQNIMNVFDPNTALALKCKNPALDMKTYFYTLQMLYQSKHLSVTFHQFFSTFST